ncbi:MAG: hypothetical protein JSV16_03560, partial [Candidatus Hydrogenedentota bacterium]
MVRFTFHVITALVLFAATAFAEEHASAALDVNTTRVIVFKDGYCMFIKRVIGKTDTAGKAFIDGIPDTMVLGTFWTIPKKGKLISALAKQQIIPRQPRQEIEKTLVLEFDPETAGREVEATLLYFGPGIRWIPTYRISLHKDGKADIAMQAEILNEAEDLNEVKVDLVVGVPNFRFKDVVSPMSLEATLRNTLQQAAPQLMSQSISNVLLSQRAGELRGRPEAVEEPSRAGVPALPPELAGEESQDLFLYHIPQLTLRAGERAVVPLVSTNIPFRHIYTWNVRLTRSGTEAVPGRGMHASPVRLLKNEVWHQIELTNKTDVPWTTGAAMVMDDYLPVAQELLTYTSVAGKCQLPLTVAVDIRGTYEEEETARELRAIRFDGNDYVRISKKGTLRVTNYKKESVFLMITCEFGGNATEAS